MSGFDIDLNDLQNLGYDIGETYSSLSVSGLLYPPGVSFPNPEFDFWEHAKPMVARFLPLLNNGVAVPPVVGSAGETLVTPWLARFPTALCGSAMRTQFILFNPYAERQGRVSGAQNPYIVLRKKIATAAGDRSTMICPVSNLPCKQVWSTIVRGDNAAMPAFTNTYFAQGLVYSDGKKFTVDVMDNNIIRPMGTRAIDRRLVMFKFSKSAGEAIAAIVINYYKQGINVVDIDKPWFFGIYNNQRATPPDVDFLQYQKMQAASAEAMGVSGFGSMPQDGRAFNHVQTADPNKKEFQKYGIHACQQARICQVDPPAEVVLNSEDCAFSKDGTIDEILKRYTPVNQAFRIMSDLEQAVLIAKAFADMPHLLRFGWADTPFIRIPAVAEIAFAETAAVYASIGDQSPRQANIGATATGMSGAAAVFGGQQSGFGGAIPQQQSGFGQVVNGAVVSQHTQNGQQQPQNGFGPPTVHNPHAGAGVRGVIGKFVMDDEDDA